MTTVPGITVTRDGIACDLLRGEYGNGRTALVLRDRESDASYAKATVNLPDEILAADEVCVKDYAEGEGTLAALIAAGVVAAPTRTVTSGYATIPVCRLLLAAAATPARREGRRG